MMENRETILQGSSDVEKGAYIGAIASLATADRQATPEEVEHLQALCEAAQLSEEQTNAVLQAANSISAEDVTQCLEILKTSELRFSFITDLIAFAKSDKDYSEEEQQNVQKMAQYLGVDQKQYSLLDHFAEKAPAPTTENATPPDEGFLSSLGIKDKLQGAGINGSSLLTGLLGLAAPLILSRMMSGGRRSGFGGGGFGMGGGMMGGGLLGGGLGSVIGMLGGRGMGSLGGVFGNILGGRRGGW